ncbi:hypothetical protein EC988_000354 [Linderina pennispora]|nr:hypothetical protein EC988_000354 [Linderina pennispora]
MLADTSNALDFSDFPSIVLTQIVQLATDSENPLSTDKYDMPMELNRPLLSLMAVCRSIRAVSAPLFYHTAFMCLGNVSPDKKRHIPDWPKSELFDIRSIFQAGCACYIRRLAMYWNTYDGIDHGLMAIVPDILMAKVPVNIAELKLTFVGLADREKLKPSDNDTTYPSLFKILTSFAPDARHIAVHWVRGASRTEYETRYLRERRYRHAQIEYDSLPHKDGRLDIMSKGPVLDSVVMFLRQRAPKLQSLSLNIGRHPSLQYFVDRLGEEHLVFPQLAELTVTSRIVHYDQPVCLGYNMFPVLRRFSSPKDFPFCDGTGLLNNPSGIESVRMTLSHDTVEKLDQLGAFRKDMYPNLKTIYVARRLSNGSVLFHDNPHGLFKKVVEMAQNPQKLIFTVIGSLDPDICISVLAGKQLAVLQCTYTKLTWIEILKICRKVPSLRHVSFALNAIDEGISNRILDEGYNVQDVLCVRSIELVGFRTTERMQTGAENAVSLAAMLPSLKRISIPMGCLHDKWVLTDYQKDAVAQPRFSQYTHLKNVDFDINERFVYHPTPPPADNPDNPLHLDNDHPVITTYI